MKRYKAYILKLSGKKLKKIVVEVELYLKYIKIIIKLLRLNLSKLLIIETVKLITTNNKNKHTP